jgi:hypothetical protein
MLVVTRVGHVNEVARVDLFATDNAWDFDNLTQLTLNLGF